MERYPLSDDTMEATYRVPASRRWYANLSLRHIALAAGFTTCMVVLGISVWSALSNRHGGVPPVIEANRGPIKVRPENPGGMQMSGQNEEILSSDPTLQAGRLAPAPEAPAPQALRAQQQEAEAAAAAAATPPPVAPPVAPPAAQPVSLPPPAAPPPAAPPIVATPAPAPTPAPAVPSVVRPAPAPAVTPQIAAPSSPVGRVQAQLAAVGSEQAAKSEWHRLSRKMPDLLGNRQPVMVKVDNNGHVVWRVRTGGFADKAQAAAFCQQVKAKGASCTVAF